MRAMFGLVALLVSIAIIALLWSMSVPTTVKKGKEAEEQIKPMTINPGVMNDSPPPAVGPGAPGTPAADRLSLSADPKGLLVSDIGAANQMALHYGLLKGDLIERAADVELRGDEGQARIFLQQAYTYQRELVVDRGGQRVQLDFKR